MKILQSCSRNAFNEHLFTFANPHLGKRFVQWDTCNQLNTQCHLMFILFKLALHYSSAIHLWSHMSVPMCTYLTLAVLPTKV